MKGEQQTTFVKEFDLTKQECDVLNAIQDDVTRAMMRFIAQDLVPKMEGVDLNKKRYTFKYDRKNGKMKVKQIVQNLTLRPDNYQDMMGWGN